MIRPTTLVLSALVLGSSLLAQSAILPKSAATKAPNYYSYHMFYGTTSTTTKSEGHVVVLYSETEVPVASVVFKQMQFRRPWYLGNQNKASSNNKFELRLSSSTRAPTAAMTTFTANHTMTPTTAFTGTINLVARNRGASWPDPWEAAVPFSTSTSWIYARQKGGSLVAETIFTGGPGHTASWYLEGHNKEVGQRTTNLSPFTACYYHSDGGTNNSISHRNPELGGSFYVYYNSMPSNVPSLKTSFMIIGIGGVGAKQWGLTLPIDLDTLNLPSSGNRTKASRGCDLAVTYDLQFGLTYVPSTAGVSRGSLRSPTFPIPNDPKLAGVSFFDQAICFDTNKTTKQVEIYTSWSSKWTVGSGLGNPMAMVYRTGDNTNPSGYAYQFRGPTLLFN